MKYWDETLFPEVLQTIRGEKYLIMSDMQINDELTALAKRAINAFMFPNIKLDYSSTETTQNEVIYQRYYFINDVSDAEISVIIAWMKYFWADFMVSNSDNFQNIYFDNNINSFSPGSVLHNYIAAKTKCYEDAKELEFAYYRKGETPSIGGTIDDD